MEDLVSHSFEKGDSNRCRNAYERILHAKLGSNILNPHKKNKVCPAAVDKKLSGRAARLASS